MGCLEDPSIYDPKVRFSMAGCIEEYSSLKEIPPRHRPKTDIRVRDGIVKIIRMENTYCGSHLFVELEKEGNLLKLMESNYNPPKDCICKYDLNMEITNLDPGVYTVELWGIEQLQVNGTEAVKLDTGEVAVNVKAPKPKSVTNLLNIT